VIPIPAIVIVPAKAAVAAVVFTIGSIVLILRSIDEIAFGSHMRNFERRHSYIDSPLYGRLTSRLHHGAYGDQSDMRAFITDRPAPAAQSHVWLLAADVQRAIDEQPKLQPKAVEHEPVRGVGLIRKLGEQGATVVRRTDDIVRDNEREFAERGGFVVSGNLEAVPIPA